MACADVFCPYLACSFAAHIFNLHNNVGIDKEYPSIRQNGAANICTSGLKPRNVKLNVIVVSPPGLSKNESINRFADASYGIFNILNKKLDVLPDGDEPFFSKVTGEITSAGFVGSVDANGSELYGDAFLYRKGILAYTEISSLFIKSEHSQDLINHVLRVMGDNFIVKRLAKKDITHDTWVTIWGGIQPSRIINIDNAGIDRRALFLFHEWTDDEIKTMIKFRSREKSSTEILRLVQDFVDVKKDIEKFVDDVKKIKKIRWNFNRKKFAAMPADLDLIEGLCIGYNLIRTDNITDVLDINLTRELRDMLVNMKNMKDKLKLYEGLIVAIDRLQKEISTKDIWSYHMKRMGYTYSQTKELLLKAHNLGFIDKFSKKGGLTWKVKANIP